MGESIPIIAHIHSALTAAEKKQAVEVACHLREKYPELTPDPIFKDLRVVGPLEGRAFHCDDLSGIQQPAGVRDLHALQERSRLRACDGDLMATSHTMDPAYAAYCCDELGLGEVRWLTPKRLDSPLQLAEACWEDREVRRILVHAIRQEDLAYVHPHQGTDAVWRLALLLSQKAHLPVRVIGAPPGLNQFANDKGKFTRVVQRLFGSPSTPPTDVVWNRATAASHVAKLADTGASVAIKLPCSAGGQGNLSLPMESVRGKSVREIDALLHELLDRVGYQSGDELLATVWESDVIGSPSAQFWIPPEGQAEPVLEGFFQQFIVEEQGEFAGATPATLPPHLAECMARSCTILATVFQQLGYVGRCSFDLVLLGQSTETATFRFIECNGRWGGTSLPMTLMNRIFGDWSIQPYATHIQELKGAGCLPWKKWRERLGPLGFDRRTGKGKFMLLNPQSLAESDQLSVIALGDDAPTAIRAMQEEFPHWARRVMEEENLTSDGVSGKRLR